MHGLIAGLPALPELPGNLHGKLQGKRGTGQISGETEGKRGWNGGRVSSCLHGREPSRLTPIRRPTDQRSVRISHGP